jgi:hypothetical protein
MGIVDNFMSQLAHPDTISLLDACHVTFPAATNDICSLFPSTAVTKLINEVCQERLFILG